MRRTFYILSILALSVVGAHAGIVIALDQASQYAQPGDLLIYTGVITNTGPDTVFLNSDSFSLSGLLTFIDQFGNVPLSLAAGGNSGQIELFDIQVNNVPLGPYPGTYNLIGGVDDSATDLLASANFDIQVVPEPATFVLLTAAFLPFIALRRARRSGRR